MELGSASVAEWDGSGQFADTLALADQLGDALWRVESAGIAAHDSPGGLVVAGVGGSGIGGLLARVALGDHASRPILLARGYGLPPWTTPDTTVLCASYSGETEETLACFEAAGALGTRRVVATTGGRLAQLAREEDVPVIPLPAGFQSRSAVAYMLVSALEVAALCGAGPRVAAEIDVAAGHLRALGEQWGPASGGNSKAKALACALHETIPVIVGSALTGPVSYRWKTQINANAKVHAFSNMLPEADHNELAGWSGGGELGPYTAVFLDDSGTHPRMKARMELTQRIVSAHARGTYRVESVGETALERVLSLVLLGDLVSLYMAVLRGVDPTPVEAISKLKRELAVQSEP